MPSYQYIYVMKDLRKVLPGGREILKDIWLSFFPGAKPLPDSVRTTSASSGRGLPRQSLPVASGLATSDRVMQIHSEMESGVHANVESDKPVPHA